MKIRFILEIIVTNLWQTYILIKYGTKLKQVNRVLYEEIKPLRTYLMYAIEWSNHTRSHHFRCALFETLPYSWRLQHFLESKQISSRSIRKTFLCTNSMMWLEQKSPRGWFWSGFVEFSIFIDTFSSPLK